MKIPAILFLVATPALYAAPGQIEPAQFYTAPYGPGCSWNLYGIVTISDTWKSAQAAAEKLTDPLGGTGKKGHLVTIGSGAENMFVYNSIVGESVWIGLTDDPAWKGAAESNASPSKGWAWVTGEPFSWSNWQTDEPTNGTASHEAGPQNAVALNRFGWWSDEQADNRAVRRRFVVEWDTALPAPVRDARVVPPVLPKQWPAASALPDGNEKGPWLITQVYAPEDREWGRLDELAAQLTKDWTAAQWSWLPDINCRLRETITGNGWGWIFEDRAFPGATTKGFGMLCRATLRVPKAGTYTFNIHADDGYAIRIGGDRPWKSVHGQGAIDPQDATVLYFSLFSPDGDSRGVIDLPAGDLPIDVFYFNVGLDGALQVMTAAGEHPLDGSTADWRLLGHKPVGKIATAGVDDSGWKVTTASGLVPGKNNLTGAQEFFAKGKATRELSTLNLTDPDSAGNAKFPAAQPYPDDGPGAQDGRLVVGEATLVIPSDGLWHIGIRADDVCSLQIEGQQWKRLIKDVSGTTAKLNGDTLSIEGPGNMPGDHELIGEVLLRKGAYPLRVLSIDRSGPSILQAFAAQAGQPFRLLTKAGAGESEDLRGLEILPPSVK